MGGALPRATLRTAQAGLPSLVHNQATLVTANPAPG